MAALRERLHGLTGLLLAGCGILLLLLLVQALWLGRNPSLNITEGDDASAQLLAAEEQLQPTDFELYGDILSQPIFFADRTLPEVPNTEQLADGDADSDEPAPLGELNATLTGVIITPDQRIALITDGVTNKTKVLKEGMALEGEQSSWQVSSIESRKVSFRAGEENAELELKVNTASLKAPASAAPAARTPRPNSVAAQRAAQEAAQSGENSDVPDNAASTADEVRRRIAERRAKLREARQKQNAQNDENK